MHRRYLVRAAAALTGLFGSSLVLGKPLPQSGGDQTEPVGGSDAQGQKPSVMMLSTVAGLRTVRGKAGAVAFVAGYHAAGDGGGGLFVWGADAEARDDGGLVFSPPGGGRGRWLREKRPAVNVVDFGARGDGLRDDAPSIQAAIDATARRGGGTVIIGATSHLVARPLILRPGVRLVGMVSPGYQEGLQYFSGDYVAAASARLVAGSHLDQAVIECDVPDDNNFGYSVENLVIDCRKTAAHGIRQAASTLRERRLLLSNIHVTGATSHGIFQATTLSHIFDKVVVSACDGYGLFADSGVSDCVYRDLYIRTCQAGGARFGPGCYFIQWMGGKIEDNYGPGMDVVGHGVGNAHVRASGVTFQHNNGPAIVAGPNRDVYVFVIGSTIKDSSVTEDKISACHFYAKGGTIVVDMCDIGGATPIAMMTEAGGAISSRNNVFSKSLPMTNRYLSKDGEISKSGDL